MVRRDLLKASAWEETSTQVVVGEEQVMGDPLVVLVLIAGKANQILRIHLDVRADFIKGIFTLGFRVIVKWYLVRSLVCKRLLIVT
jgi:hypothetical protein